MVYENDLKSFGPKARAGSSPALGTKISHLSSAVEKRFCKPRVEISEFSGGSHIAGKMSWCTRDSHKVVLGWFNSNPRNKLPVPLKNSYLKISRLVPK